VANKTPYVTKQLIMKHVPLPSTPFFHLE
jgi:hypothetical protein